MTRRFLIFLFAVSVSFCVAAEVTPLPPEVSFALERLPIQHNGRVKPFDSFAKEILDLITGSRSFGSASAVATVLQIAAYPERWDTEPLLSVPYRPLRQELGFSSKKSHLSYQELTGSGFMRRLPAIVQKQQADEKLTILENEIMDLYFRFTTLHKLFNREFPLVPSQNHPDAIWVLPADLAEMTRKQGAADSAYLPWIDAYREGNTDRMLQEITLFSETVRQIRPAALPPPWRLSLEVWYNRLNPFRWAWVLYAVAAVLFGLSPSKRFRPLRGAAWGVVGVAFLLFHLGGIVVRVILAGRPPVSNFYETMFWLAFITVFLGLGFELWNKSGHIGLASTLFGGVVLLLSEHLPLDPALQPVVAVLRSNLWLSVHVLTIVGSYGILTLATAIAHVYAVGILLRKGKKMAPVGDSLYRVVQIGVVMLATGIMLGGVWANASWGRYWGWDPKETWALITLLWFLAMLHARKATWIGAKGLAIGTIVGFFLLLMTYYGVSFYLVGLHSYAGGHATPIPPLLIGFVLAECLFVFSVYARSAKRLTPPKLTR